jgi:nucleotidyltransferase substrate binding protein (TIGR01987 family)
MKDEEIFRSFAQSIKRFSEILGEPKTVANRDSAIKRFELTFELAWKSAKAWSSGQGVVCRSPRDCFAQMFRLGLILDNPLWLKMIEDRNLSVHTYSEKLAEEIYARLTDYLPLFAALNDSLDKARQ